MNASGQQLLVVGKTDGTLGDENSGTSTNLDVECVQISLSLRLPHLPSCSFFLTQQEKVLIRQQL